MKTKKKYIEVNNKIYIHPSVYLWDYLENKKMTIKDFADKSHIDNTKLLKFVSLRYDINKEFAKELENATKIEQKTWLNLQKSFDKGYKKWAKENQ